MTDFKKQKVDIVSVANAAKVSPATVSRFFNRPELVKLNTRRRIDRAVKKLGYIRNRAAQTIHGIRSGTIGIVVPTIDHTIFAEVVQTFSDTVGVSGFTILLGSHNYDDAREYEILRKFLEHRVDGVALIGLDHSEDVFNLIESQNIPSMLLWAHAPVSRLPCVGADNHQAGQMIAEHVIDAGHRDILTIFPPLAGNDRAASRADGVHKTLRSHGIEPAHMLQAPYSVASAKSAVIDHLAKTSPPKAIICGNDVLALGAIYAVQSRGLRVPDDIAITGIGDFKGSGEVEPGITTVRIPANTIGREGGEALVHSIVSPGEPAENKRCPTDLIIRASC